MNTKIYWLEERVIEKGQLAIMARPRGNDWLRDELIGLKAQKVNVLVSLLEWIEVMDLGLIEEGNICHSLGIDFIHFPIQDGSIPKSRKDMVALVNELLMMMQNEKKVVIHCRMGIGRSSVLAAAILIKYGVLVDEVFHIISGYRKIEVPDTEEQKKWILDLSEELKRL